MLLSDKTERSGSPTSYLYLTLIFPPYSTSRKKCYRNDQFTAYSNKKTHISQLPLSDSWMEMRKKFTLRYKAHEWLTKRTSRAKATTTTKIRKK